MDKKFLYYSKFVNVTKGEIETIVERIEYQLECENYNVCELGSGWGNLSIPFISLLKDKILEWHGFESEPDKISFFNKFLNGISQETVDYNQGIKELRSTSLIKDTPKEFCNLYKHITSLSEESDNKISINELNLNKSVSLEELKKLNNIDIIFIPFIFQHIKNWKNVLKTLISKSNNDFLIVSGELSGDWEAVFSPYKTTAFTYWKEFFIDLWDRYTIIPNTLRDYKYYNMAVLHSFLQSQKLKVTEYYEHPVDIEVMTSQKEFIEQMKEKVWSPFIQNLPKNSFKEDKDSYDGDLKVFTSRHIFNIIKIEK